MENKLKLVIYPAAQEDLEQIFSYISEKLCNPTAAIKQIEDFENALDTVCLFPQSCPFTENEYVKDRTLRKLVVNNYIVFYRVKNEEIQVIRVIYGMRDYAKIL